MRRLTLAVAGSVLLGLSGCVVQSLGPCYTEAAKVEQPDLAGAWKVQEYLDQKDQAKLEKIKPWVFDGESLTVYDGNNAKAVIGLTLFKVADQLYADVTAEGAAANELWLFLVRPMHSLCKVELKDRTLVLTPFSLDWFEQKRKAKELPLPFTGATTNEKDDLPVYTATPQQWMDFLAKHGKDEGLFMDKRFTLRKFPEPPEANEKF